MDRPFYISELRLLESIGIEIRLGWDDRLEIACRTSPEQIIERLEAREAEILPAVRYRMRLQRNQLVGGPCNGTRHHAEPNDVIAIHLRRRVWALYQVMDDGRAFYRGDQTSEDKARRKSYSLRANKYGGYIFGRFHVIQAQEEQTS